MKIITFGNPICRKIRSVVDVIDKEIRKLIRDMFETLYAAPGVGLAAKSGGSAVKSLRH